LDTNAHTFDGFNAIQSLNNPPKQEGTRMKLHPLRIAFAIAVLNMGSLAHGAQGEMGTGVPVFGQYSQATGVGILVSRLENASIGFPAGCTGLWLSPGTMGMDSYKIAAATLIAARVSNRSVRFFAHAPRDNGCGVDYVELA
jgi:hypothetical protein